MAAILDAATMLAPAGQVTSSQDFPALLLRPRTLPTCHWVVSMLIPPAASATFRLQVATTEGGTYSTIATHPWPAATSGSKQVPIGVSGALAHVLNNTSVYVRVSVTLTGPLTLAGSWLAKASDGGPGLGSRSYALDTLNSL
jgi:hypothetical protein